MDRELFLLKTESNWAVSLGASKAFPSQQLAQKLLLGLSQGCAQCEFFALGFSCSCPDVLRFMGLCLGH